MLTFVKTLRAHARPSKEISFFGTPVHESFADAHMSWICRIQIALLQGPIDQHPYQDSRFLDLKVSAASSSNLSYVSDFVRLRLAT